MHQALWFHDKSSVYFVEIVFFFMLLKLCSVKKELYLCNLNPILFTHRVNDIGCPIKMRMSTVKFQLTPMIQQRKVLLILPNSIHQISYENIEPYQYPVNVILSAFLNECLTFFIVKVENVVSLKEFVYKN